MLARWHQLLNALIRVSGVNQALLGDGGLHLGVRLRQNSGRWCFACCICLLAANSPAAEIYLSHPPMRPLPQAMPGPLPQGPARYVDAAQGSDDADGSLAKPYRTVHHAAGQLQPGETLYLRGGIYYEHATVTARGTAEMPITIRSYPGELAIIDGGLREFFESPATAWEPNPTGVPGEFRSTRTYPDLGGQADQTNLLGNFGDSMIPLQGYRFLGDLRSDNPYWNVTNKVGAQDYVYCGPGVYYDPASGRIHARLAHTTLSGLGDDNYRGETDPRKVPLVIAAATSGPPLTLQGVQHLRLQDLVLRGARTATLEIADGRHIELSGLTAYGGSSAINVRDTWGLRMEHTACRGIAAPWTFRGSLKYRSIEARILSASRWDPTGWDNRDFELAYCEFTDCVDGVFLGNVSGVRFHHNLVENVSDDGIFLTAATAYDGHTPGGNVHVYQNRLARCLTTFAFGVGHGRQKAVEGGYQTGSGANIYRNVFDFRRPVMYRWPNGPEDEQELDSYGRVAGDHGGPAWEPMNIYHNTILAGVPPRYDYGTSGLAAGTGRGTTRRVFNNIVCQMQGMIGQTLPGTQVDYASDGNLFWSLTDGPTFQGEIFSKFRNSAAFKESQQRYAAGWTAHDQFADPRFMSFSADWKTVPDLRLHDRSPAINAGVKLPSEWPDALAANDSGKPDLGAVPLGSQPWHVGVRGRLNVFGGEGSPTAKATVVRWEFAQATYPETRSKVKALVYRGYPAFDAPLVAYALRRAGAKVAERERSWLAPERFRDYDIIAVDGNFTRAKIEPNRFSGADIKHVRTFLEDGGTLLLMSQRTDLFASPEGREFLTEIVGTAANQGSTEYQVLLPEHRWVKHLASLESLPWLEGKLVTPLRGSRIQPILGTTDGVAALCRIPVGKGELVYLGWNIARSLPNGRTPTTIEEEAEFADQMQVLLKLAEDTVNSRR